MSNEKKLWKYDEAYVRLAKMRVKNNDVVICYFKTDGDGCLLTSVNQVRDTIDEIGALLDKMKINAAVIAIPDKIAIDDVKSAKNTVRDLQNVIDYVNLAVEKAGGPKNKEKKPAAIDVKKLMQDMSFKGEEETQVYDGQ